MNESNETQLQEFEYETYARTSENNRPIKAAFVPLSDDERAMAESALRIS